MDTQVEEVNGVKEPLSKKQKKKLMKKQKWLETKQERRKKEKLKMKQKRAVAKAQGLSFGPDRKKLKQCTMSGSSCKQQIVVDMSFEEFMMEKDIGKCAKQIHRSYSANRRVDNPTQLYITSFHGQFKEILSKNIGYSNWDLHYRTEFYRECFRKEDLVYLSSDSDNIIDKLDESKVYVIGGLVDHNAHKGLCHKLAVENGIQHARLPIDEYIVMKTRKVLTIDQVFRILLGVTQGKSWKDSFLEIIPARKGATDKDGSPDNSEEEQVEDASKSSSCNSVSTPSAETDVENGNEVSAPKDMETRLENIEHTDPSL
ncbi:tRNA methyltransferase 10 homolog A-like [Oratosquilla oratoria]|uniref:tRNA methyltransferase 10 homolog A-like n=1 Tax=Oratosquilla oratoria TaxID=337810 RepID=UPI003F761780